ncbi:AMP-binding protein [Acidimicrobiaceae bacterium USS-CC1]|uniref:AMP-binding protein n=1 Tax=Acidiferrimicrobium australe TaxID=2664430 RepID=A0ABW9QT78_9ACTN|nr:AMP-binding protein [Acidiferrimicrobium australe]
MHPGIFAEVDPDRPAIVMAGTGEVTTYRQLDEAANRAARALAAAGVGPGDHIAFQLTNGPGFFALLWAAHRSGVVYTATSTRLTAEETAYIVGDCGARVFVGDAALPELTASLADRLDPGVTRFVAGGTADGWAPWDEATAAQAPDPAPGPFAGDDMLYSSGTTGRPKGVLHHLAGVGLDEPDGVTRLCQLFFGMDDRTVYLSPAPLYHAAPLRFTRAVQRTGGTVVVMEHFDAAWFLELLGRHGVTMTQVVPTMFVRMLKLPPEVRAAADVSSLRCAVHAAAPCPVAVKQQMIDWWGPIVWEYYAGTEGNGLVLCDSPQWLAHPGTVGRPLIGEVHVVGEDGAEVPAGTVGTVYFGGGADFEYLHDPAKTAAAHHPAGWTTLGDIGYVDGDGFLYLTDRKADMIISGGVNVYPQEAENVLALHPKVADVAVFGVPDDDLGEAVKAVVEPIDPADAGPALAAELIAYCRSQLAHYKCPLSVDFEAELPRHPTGKLYKRLLKDRYWAGHATRIN